METLKEDIKRLVSLEEYARNYILEDGLSFYDMYAIDQQPNLDDIVASFFENDEIEDLDL